MFVCKTHQALFIAVPKTGTRTIYKVLEDHFYGKQQGDHVERVPDKLSGLFTFITKRNPYDRACSIYWAMCRRNGDQYKYKQHFKEKGLENTLLNFLIELKAGNYQSKRIRHFRGQHLYYGNRIDAILRFEHLEEDFHNLPFVKAKVNLPKLNTTTVKHIPTPEKPIPHPVRPHWEEMVGPKEGKLINEIYQKDFELLGYEMRKY